MGLMKRLYMQQLEAQHDTISEGLPNLDDWEVEQLMQLKEVVTPLPEELDLDSQEDQ